MPIRCKISCSNQPFYGIASRQFEACLLRFAKDNLKWITNGAALKHIARRHNVYIGRGILCEKNKLPSPQLIRIIGVDILGYVATAFSLKERGSGLVYFSQKKLLIAGSPCDR